MRSLLACLLAYTALCCSVLEPDYLEVSPYTQFGDHDFSRPVSTFDEETYGIMFTLGYNIGEQAQAFRNLAMLDVSRGGELTMRGDGGDVNVAIQDSAEGESSTQEESIVDVFDPSETKEEAHAFVIWSLGIVILAAAALIARKAGVRLPFTHKDK